MMLSMTRILTTAVLAVALALAGCNRDHKLAETGKRYAMKGEIKALDPKTDSATIDAGDIGDWMGAMTMDYPIKPNTEFQKLHVGDKIEAVVVVNDPAYYVTDIKVLPK